MLFIISYETNTKCLEIKRKTLNLFYITQIVMLPAYTESVIRNKEC